MSAPRFMYAGTHKQTRKHTNKQTNNYLSAPRFMYAHKQTNKQTTIRLHPGVCLHLGLSMLTLKNKQTN